MRSMSEAGEAASRERKVSRAFRVCGVALSTDRATSLSPRHSMGASHTAPYAVIAYMIQVSRVVLGHECAQERVVSAQETAGNSVVPALTDIILTPG